MTIPAILDAGTRSDNRSTMRMRGVMESTPPELYREVRAWAGRSEEISEEESGSMRGKEVEEWEWRRRMEPSVGEWR